MEYVSFMLICALKEKERNTITTNVYVSMHNKRSNVDNIPHRACLYHSSYCKWECYFAAKTLYVKRKTSTISNHTVSNILNFNDDITKNLCTN